MAASKKIGLVLALDKDKEFKDSLKACKDEVKGYKEELKDLTDGFKTNKTTMEGLEKVQEKITSKQEAYKKQLDAAKTGLQNANTQYDKQNSHLQELKKKLEEAEKAQDAMNDEGKEGTEEYKKQAEEVDKLREAVQKQAANVATAETNVNKWNREIRNAEQGIRDCDKELEDNANDMKDLATQTDKAGDQMDEFADDTKDAAEQSGKLSIGIGDMIKNKIVSMAADGLVELGKKALEAAKYIVQVGSEFEAQMSKVKAISNASEQDMAKLTEAAKEMGRTTKFTATEAGEALEYMAMAGWKTEDMLSGLEGIMNLAAASGADLGTTSDIVTDALTAFGQSAEESGRLADIMAAASSNANTNVEMMGETFKYAAPVAGALGYSMEDTATAIGLMANAGIKASQAGTAIRTGLTRLVSPTKQAREAMEAYGISVTDTDGNMLSFHDLMVQIREKLGGLDEAEQAAATSAIFGKNAMSGWLAVVNASDEDFNKLTNAINDSEGSAARMAGTMQDNLQGKMTLLNSAIEGFGIALYNYFSGPLQTAVDLATGFINNITNIIDPPKNELQTFVEEIKLSNDQVTESIKHAKETVSNAETKVAELSAYKEEFSTILGQCEQFNLVTLDTGEKAIVDSAGNIVEKIGEVGTETESVDDIIAHFAERGLNTSDISKSSDSAQEMIGYVEDKVDTVEERLKSFAAQGFNTKGIKISQKAVVQVFDGLNAEEGPVNTFEANINSLGELEFDTTNLSAGQDLYVTAFNSMTGEVETFKGSLEDLNTEGAVSLDNIVAEWDNVEDSVTRTYHITDEFTKHKIDTIVSSLGDAVGDLANAWDAQTGTLTASKKELEAWFDTAKQVAMYNALQESINELYSSWGKAAVNVAKSESALAEAEKEVAYWQEKQDSVTQEASEWANYHEELIKAQNALADTNDEHEEAIELMGKAEDQIRLNGDTLNNLKETVGDVIQAEDGMTESGEEAASALEMLAMKEGETEEATEGLTDAQLEAIKAFQEMSGQTIDGLADLQDQLEMTDEEFADWCKSRVDEVQPIIDAYQDLVQQIAESLQSYVTGLDSSGEEGSNAIDNIVSNLQKKASDLQAWVDNMKELGEMAGKELPQALYDQLLQEGPEKTAEAVQALVDAAHNEKDKFEQVADEYSKGLQIEAEAENLAAYSSTGKAYAEAVKNGFVGSVDDYEQAVKDGMVDGAGTAKDAAGEYTEAGAQAGENISTSIEGQEQAITQASESVVKAGSEAAETASEMFREVGHLMMLAMSAGMNGKKDAPIERVQKIMDEIKDNLTDTKEVMKNSGNELMASLKEGIASANVPAEISQMISDVKDELQWSNYDMENAGQDAADSYAQGIGNNSSGAVYAAGEMASRAQNAASSYTNAFYNTGYYMAAGLADGIYSGRSRAINAAMAVASSALAAARRGLEVRSPSKKFEELGKMSDEGLAKGFDKNIGIVTSQVEDSMYDVMKAAKETLSDQNVELSSTAINNISTDSMRTLGSIASVQGSVGDVASVINAFRSEVASRMADLSDIFTEQGNRRATVTLQVGSRTFDAYIVDTASKGMGAMSKSLQRGVGLV